MVGGSLVTSVCLVMLGWTKEIVELFMRQESDTRQKVVVVTAVLAIYALDFAINVVQACCRSIIVDVLPTQQQQIGSAWAARMAASGHVVGFLIGTLPLVDILPTWLGGDTQFKKMTLICYSIHDNEPPHSPTGHIVVFFRSNTDGARAI